jgi:hypothetical protein
MSQSHGTVRTNVKQRIYPHWNESANHAICYLHRFNLLFQTYPVHEPTNLRHV